MSKDEDVALDDLELEITMFRVSPTGNLGGQARVMASAVQKVNNSEQDMHLAELCTVHI